MSFFYDILVQVTKTSFSVGFIRGSDSSESLAEMGDVRMSPQGDW